MTSKSLLFAAAIAISVPVFAQQPDSKAARDARNWDALHQMYPARAILAREEGLVGFKVKIDATGMPTECKVTHSSGHSLLDNETCQLIMSHATFKRPEGASLSQERSYEGVVNWKLPTTPASVVPAPPKPVAAASAPEKIICRRTLKAGSNAAFERTCLPESDWKREGAEGREMWRRLRNQGFCTGAPPCSGGN